MSNHVNDKYCSFPITCLYLMASIGSEISLENSGSAKLIGVETPLLSCILASWRISSIYFHCERTNMVHVRDTSTSKK